MKFKHLIMENTQQNLMVSQSLVMLLALMLLNRTRTDGFWTARLRSPGFRTSNGFERNNSTKWFKCQRSKSIYHDSDSLFKIILYWRCCS